MADSTTNLTTIASSGSQQAVTANGLIDASSPATLFGRNAATAVGLTWGFYGGKLLVDGVVTPIANGTVALSASTTNYVEASRAGVVSKNTTGFTAGAIPLYTVVTGASTVTSYTDHRTPWYPVTGKLVKAMADANQTLTAAEARAQILETSGALTAQRNLVVPLGAQQWTVYNGCTGFGVQVIGASGTGVVIGAGKRAIVYADGTNVVRATADV